YSRLRAVPWFTNKFIYDPTTGPITDQKKEQALEGWRHERWGATFGGPVVLPKLYNGRNKTFWVFGYEGLYIMRNLNGTYNLPAEQQSARQQAGHTARPGFRHDPRPHRLRRSAGRRLCVQSDDVAECALRVHVRRRCHIAPQPDDGPEHARLSAEAGQRDRNQ